MGVLAPKTEVGFEREAYTRTFVDQKLADYALMLEQFDAGLFNQSMTRREITVWLDRWLDELIDVADLRWVPSPEEELKMANGWRN